MSFYLLIQYSRSKIAGRIYREYRSTSVFEYIFCLILKYLLEFFFWLVFTNVFNYLNSNHDYGQGSKKNILIFMVVRQSASRQSADTKTVNRQTWKMLFKLSYQRIVCRLIFLQSDKIFWFLWLSDNPPPDNPPTQ
jgi:hypothetical protein